MAVLYKLSKKNGKLTLNSQDLETVAAENNNARVNIFSDKLSIQRVEPVAEVTQEEPAAEVAQEEPAAEVAQEEPAAEVTQEEPAAENDIIDTVKSVEESVRAVQKAVREMGLYVSDTLNSVETSLNAVQKIVNVISQ